MSHHVLAWEIDPRDPDMFVVFCDDQHLYSFDRRNSAFHSLALLESIAQFDSIMLYLHGDYICVVENFATHGVVFNRNNATTMPIEREDYHAGVSSYSIGFLERNGHTLLIHQTQWNRLDITDLTTGQLLTERVIRHEKIGVDENHVTQFIAENFADFFHGLILVSPNCKRFLSNGWVWHPMGTIACYDLEQFLKTYEPGGYYTFGTDNWDIPCAFLDDTTFIVGCSQDMTDYGDNWDVEQDENHVQKLLFYNMNTTRERTEEPINVLATVESTKAIDADIFPMDEFGAVNGRLYFDDQTRQLIAMSERGTYILTLDGKAVAHRADITFPYWVPPCWKSLRPVVDCVNWKYSPQHRLFHSWSSERQTVDVLPLDDLLASHFPLPLQGGQ